MKVSVIGCGRWGTFLAWYLDRSGQEVTLYGRKGSKRMEALVQTRTNGVTTLPQSVGMTQDLGEALENDTLVIWKPAPASGFPPLWRKSFPPLGWRCGWDPAMYRSSPPACPTVWSSTARTKP